MRDYLYPDRSKPQLGWTQRWRGVADQVVEKFLECGDLEFGYARVACVDCGHEGLAEPAPTKQRPDVRWAMRVGATRRVARTIVDPLECPKCGGRMRVTGFVELTRPNANPAASVRAGPAASPTVGPAPPVEEEADMHREPFDDDCRGDSPEADVAPTAHNIDYDDILPWG